MKNDVSLLNHENPAFAQVFKDFDDVLRRTVGNMTLKNAENATLTLKLDLSLKGEDIGSLNEPEEVVKPSFKHQITSVMQVKEKISGHFNDDCEVVWDSDLGEYVTRPIKKPQMSFFDGDDCEDDFVDAEGINVEVPMIEAHSEEDEECYPGFEVNPYEFDDDDEDED